MTMEKPWLNSYPAGVPADIALEDIGTIGEFLQTCADQFSEARAFISGATGKHISYRELDVLSARFAAQLQQLGLKPGARVAMMMPNLLQYPICQMGALRAGYVVVNVNPMYTPRELAHQLADCDAEAIVILENFAHVLQAVLAQTQLRHVIVTGAADMLSLPLRLLAGTVLLVKGLIPPYRLPGHLSLRQILKNATLPAMRVVKGRPEDLAFLQYTGGTTGTSKGAMLTHRNVLANVRQCLVWTEPFIDRSQEILSITAIPIYHIFAMGTALNMMALGGTNVLIADPRNTRALVKVLQRYRFVSFPAVNTLFNSLLNEPGFRAVDFSRLRLAMGGGAAIQPAVAMQWQKITGTHLSEGYGLTECSPTVTVNPFDLTEFNGSIGLPLPGTDVSLRDAQGQVVGVGERGELCVKGPQVMAGYWKRPEETAAVMTADGYLRTGDVATMDEKGFFRIVDRIKDLILISGFNVYPNEIEAVVTLHPDVLEAAAVGMDDAATGETVHVFVVRKQDTLTAADVVNHCRANLVNYKVPRHIHLVDALPKSPVGKVLRRELRDRLGKGQTP